jgi:hypothetical protein
LEIDQGINAIKRKNDPKQGVVITIENFEKCQCQWFYIKLKNWWFRRVKLPVEIWQKNTRLGHLNIIALKK